VNPVMSLVPILAQTEGSSDGGSFAEFAVFTLIAYVFVSWLAKAISTKADRSWLPRLIMWGFAVKILGTLARFWMVTVLYGTGDSYVYHLFGTINANVWQAFQVPVGTAGGQGTAFTEVVTSFLYAVYTPTFLGGFFIFSMLSFMGQLLFFSAFRPWFGQEKVKLYAYAILFFPSLVFWPAGIGKDALMVFSLGLATYGVSRLLRTYQISAVLLIAPGLFLAASIRPHVAGIFGIATVASMLLGKAPKKLQGHPKRALMILTALAGVAVLLATFSATFDVTVEGAGATQDPGEFLSDVNERTATGGSQIEGGGIASPSQLPLAIVTVLFRPLIHEGRNAQVIVSALEGTAMLALVVWKMPTIWRNRRLLRTKAMVTLCFFYTGGFVLAFSAILNLGILARQRVQVLPFFLALIVALAWDEPKDEDGANAARLERLAPRRPPKREPIETAAVTQPSAVTEENGRHQQPSQ
jgi:hypothetical protein